MSDYSRIDKFLHKAYLSNYFLSKSSFELEDSLYSSSISKLEIDQHVFVTGLARSGTTSLMRLIYQTNEYASLTYNNMPFLFMPNLWKNNRDKLEKVRAHKDGIKVSGKSPEEFDEYFWKVFLNDSYIQDNLLLHAIPQAVLTRYITYVKLIAHSQKKNKWVSKNNNNILRLKAISKLNGSRILILYRDPVDHASSLLKQHTQFEKMQKEEPFVKDYFNYLGHHEFGFNHKPFQLIPDLIEEMKLFNTSNLNYWIIYWMNYYQYLIENFKDHFSLISFSDLSDKPKIVTKMLSERLDIDAALLEKKKYVPPSYSAAAGDSDIIERANKIYNSLHSLRKYG